MTTELTMLAYAAALLLVLIIVQATSAILAQGLPAMAGNRDDLPPPKMFQSRTRRLVDNHREGLTLFAPLILAAAVAHVSNGWTVLGAELFFYARLAHAILYLLGVPWVRALAWGVGMVGTIMVLAALFGLG
ncbi:MAG TPA: MAPEG family protein [Caulobacteraceae bacterium]|jgi:uncharacterized MAPEG superfamily protein